MSLLGSGPKSLVKIGNQIIHILNSNLQEIISTVSMQYNMDENQKSFLVKSSAY